jgi:diaminopimelate epimerase
MLIHSPSRLPAVNIATVRQTVAHVRQKGDMTGRIIQFTKMSGSGNDFVVIDNRSGVLDGLQIAAFTRAVCRHRISVGADGVVILSGPPERDSALAYTWRYVNADGSDGEMCGNGAMCAARFAVRAGIAEPHHRFLTPSGVVEAWAEAANSSTAIAIADPERIEEPVEVSVLGRVLCCARVVVGVPHIVIRVDDADAFAEAESFHAIGRALRLHGAFAPAGTNVNVVSQVNDETWRMRTYERGVEAETLACGTGAVASAIVLGHQGLAQSPTRIRTSSGRDLTVSYDLGDGQATNVRLAGHAAVIYDGTLTDEAVTE